MKLQETLKGLICEIASVDSVVNAIKNKQKVIIYYDGDEPGGRGLREIEPVCLGTSKAGNKVLRAWDEEGSSHTAYKGEQPLPGWRMFRLDKILSIKPTGEIYNTPRPGYNFNGDKSMVRVIINAKFDNQPAAAVPQTTEPVTSPTTPTPTPTPTEGQI
jgi:predicted DNA-binding transcriptional regulator YafY